MKYLLYNYNCFIFLLLISCYSKNSTKMYKDEEIHTQLNFSKNSFENLNNSNVLVSEAETIEKEDSYSNFPIKFISNDLIIIERHEGENFLINKLIDDPVVFFIMNDEEKLELAETDFTIGAWKKLDLYKNEYDLEYTKWIKYNETKRKEYCFKTLSSLEISSCIFILINFPAFFGFILLLEDLLDFEDCAYYTDYGLDSSEYKECSNFYFQLLFMIGFVFFLMTFTLLLCPNEIIYKKLKYLICKLFRYCKISSIVYEKLN